MKKSFPPGLRLEDVDCPNGCRRDDIFVLKGKDLLHSIPGEFNIYRCQKCGLERTMPRPTPGTIGVYYPTDYAPYHDAPSSQIGSKRAAKEWIRRIIGVSSRTLPPVRPGRMLEIGCSSGIYMQEARRAGWNVEGIEFSADAAAVAQNKGFLVRVGAIENLESSGAEYDLVTAWMVLEHLHEPVNVLRKLRAWVKPDGYLVALVPSSKSLSRKIFGSLSYDLQLPTHLFHYSPETLGVVLNKAGWKIERVFWQRNCITLLRSFEYWSRERKSPTMVKLAQWLRVGRGSALFRTLLSMLLGMTQQSGRIEIWARPTVDASNSGLDMQNNSRPVEV